MDKILTVLNSIHGKKTYIVGIFACVFGGWLLTHDQADMGMQFVTAGFGLMTLRHAIAKGTAK